ncbi:MAG: hypothetical protein R6W70_04895 [bacterium]
MIKVFCFVSPFLFLFFISCNESSSFSLNQQKNIFDEDDFYDDIHEQVDVDCIERDFDENNDNYFQDFDLISDEDTDMNCELYDEDSVSNEPCGHLFGIPNENTGLTPEQCKPFFNCEGMKFEAPFYTEEEIEWIESRNYLNPPEEMMSNPYDNPESHPHQPEKFCGIKFENTGKKDYTLHTYNSMEKLEQAGALLTHTGACGHCSSLQSLAVYIKNGDLTGPVRSCASKGIYQNEEKTMECLMDIGFDRICAKVWYYNTKNTRSQCILKCLDGFNSLYHNPDGTLNECIQCDEEKSGPVFKATSGRTRRNSGLPTALCRPCHTISKVKHHYH